MEDILACRVTRDLVKPHSRWLKRRPDGFRNPAGDDDDGREAIVAHLPEIAAMRSWDDECVPRSSRRYIQEGNDGIVAVEDACGKFAGGYLAKDTAWITHHGGAYLGPRAAPASGAAVCRCAPPQTRIRAAVPAAPIKAAVNAVCLRAGATGLEPATSGVTGRVGHNDARRRAPPNGLICRRFSPPRRTAPHG